MDVCAVCHSPASTGRALSMCSSCQTVAYCGPACQRAHWKAHKVACREAAEVHFRHILSRAEAGHAIDQYRVGTCYSAGKGVVKDAAQAAVWFMPCIRSRHC